MQPRVATDTVRRLFDPDFAVVTSLGVGGDSRKNCEDDILKREDDITKKEDDRKTRSPVLMVGN